MNACVSLVEPALNSIVFGSAYEGRNGLFPFAIATLPSLECFFISHKWECLTWNRHSAED